MNTRDLPRAVPVRTFSLPELGPVHGVARDDDGRLWFACGSGDLVRLDPSNGRVLRRFDGIGASAGTTWDGSAPWQITDEAIVRLDPESGAVLRSIPKPDGVHCSGMAWVDGALWIGDFDGRALVKVDAETGAVLKRLESDRLVTGVDWTGGELWHGGWDRADEPSDTRLRRVDPESGAVREDLDLDRWTVSGVTADEDRFWCGGSGAGGLRAVRRP